MERHVITVPLRGINLPLLFAGNTKESRAMQIRLRRLLKEKTPVDYTYKINRYSFIVDHGDPELKDSSHAVAKTNEFIESTMRELYIIRPEKRIPCQGGKMVYNKDFSKNYAEVTITVHA